MGHLKWLSTLDSGIFTLALNSVEYTVYCIRQPRCIVILREVHLEAEGIDLVMVYHCATKYQDGSVHDKMSLFLVRRVKKIYYLTHKRKFGILVSYLDINITGFSLKNIDSEMSKAEIMTKRASRH